MAGITSFRQLIGFTVACLMVISGVMILIGTMMPAFIPTYRLRITFGVILAKIHHTGFVESCDPAVPSSTMTAGISAKIGPTAPPSGLDITRDRWLVGCRRSADVIVENR